MLSWIYLLGINFCYYILFCHFLGKQTEIPVYEEKKPPCAESESVLANRDRKSVSETVSFLMQYDVISFDIFDTLIFRPFSEPTDLFFFLGEKTGILDFKRLRMQAEAEARTQKYKEEKHYEIKLSDIWSRLENEIGVTKEQGMQMEQALEMEICYANTFMQQVFTLRTCIYQKHLYRSCCKKTAMEDMRNYMFPVNMKRVRQRVHYMKL